MDNIEFHYMLDLETLSTAPNAHILELALVGFDPNTGKTKPHRTFSYTFGGNVDQKGAHVSRSTVAWHVQQGGFEKYFIKDHPYVDFETAIKEMVGHFYELKNKGIKVRVWCTGMFDVDILNSAANRLGLSHQLIRTFDVRDVRTVRQASDDAKLQDRSSEVVTHNAYEDCIRQIGYVTNVYRALNNGASDGRTTSTAGDTGGLNHVSDPA